VTLPVSPAEAAYERQGRALFSTLFRGCGYDFEAPRWDIRHLRTSQHKKTNSQVHFTITLPRWIHCRRVSPTS